MLKMAQFMCFSCNRAFDTFERVLSHACCGDAASTDQISVASAAATTSTPTEGLPCTEMIQKAIDYKQTNGSYVLPVIFGPGNSNRPARTATAAGGRYTGTRTNLTTRPQVQTRAAHKVGASKRKRASFERDKQPIAALPQKIAPAASTAPAQEEYDAYLIDTPALEDSSSSDIVECEKCGETYHADAAAAEHRCAKKRRLSSAVEAAQASGSDQISANLRGEGAFACAKCNRSFTSALGLQIHLRYSLLHDPDNINNRPECPHCGRRISPNNMSQHKKICAQKPSLADTASRQPIAARHVHHDSVCAEDSQAPELVGHRCEKCNMTFTVESTLRRHERYSLFHDKENIKNWKECSKCGDKYHPHKQRGHVCRKSSTHEVVGEEDESEDDEVEEGQPSSSAADAGSTSMDEYRCEKCGTSYTNGANLKRHEQYSLSHDKENTKNWNDCSTCGEKYAPHQKSLHRCFPQRKKKSNYGDGGAFDLSDEPMTGKEEEPSAALAALPQPLQTEILIKAVLQLGHLGGTVVENRNIALAYSGSCNGTALEDLLSLLCFVSGRPKRHIENLHAQRQQGPATLRIFVVVNTDSEIT